MALVINMWSSLRAGVFNVTGCSFCCVMLQVFLEMTRSDAEHDATLLFLLKIVEIWHSVSKTILMHS
jgi:hypothetical protein